MRKPKVIGTCEVCGDEGRELVLYNGQYMIRQIRDERINAAVRPSQLQIYEAQKKEFDEWTT